MAQGGWVRRRDSGGRAMTPVPFPDLIDDRMGEVVDRGDGRFDAVFRRRIRKPLEKVWAALTVPERIADWFTEADLELRIGGRYRLRFPQAEDSVDGRIVELDPPRLLAHTWPHAEHPGSIVRYELERDGEGCRLTLTQTDLAPRHWDVLAGWHTFLRGLPGATEGVGNPWSAAIEAEVRKLYGPLRR